MPDGDVFRQWRVGEKRVASAAFFNSVIESRNVLLRQQHDGGGAGRASADLPVTCWVQNTSGNGVLWGSVLEIAGPLWDFPSGGDDAAESAFVRLPGVVGTQPGNDTSKPFVVTVEPIPANEIGRAVIFGLAAVQIDVQSSDDRTAGLCGETYLKGGVPGPRIVAAPTSTGRGWAYVLVGSKDIVELHGVLSEELSGGGSARADLSPTGDANATVWDWRLPSSNYKLANGTEISCEMRGNKIWVQTWKLQEEQALGNLSLGSDGLSGPIVSFAVPAIGDIGNMTIGTTSCGS